MSLPPGMLAPDGELVVGPTGAGPLDGVTVAVKDLFDVAGRVTAAGNPTLAAGVPASSHAEAVARLLRAGATVVGKTATDELAMGMFGANTHYGTPPNPAAPDRVPGGSSSGSASAVAAGLADLGLGTDTGGSIRVPGAFCGLVGLRPTHGRIDTAGLRPMAPRFDTVGLLAREVATVGAAFGALAAAPRAPRGVRRLVLLTDLLDLAAPEVATATMRTAVRLAEATGLQLVGLPLLDDPLPEGMRAPELLSVFWPLMSRQLWHTNGAWLREADPTLGEGIADRIRVAGTVTDAEVRAAESGRARLVQRLESLLLEEVAVLPTTIAAAPLRTSSHASLMDYRDRNLPLVVPASLAGAPQLTLPAGRVTDYGTGTSAPVGVSLLGLPGDDELLLDLAAAVPS
ncbi:amidase family protein [Nocardioides houyundeii]|uniref:amidase family protein n=1 Tax=Nocardioides houyundeii TaxID=2045452 RepID=UPI000DF3F26C|nr:amidase family protein [Nocardioides houyundeii]